MKSLKVLASPTYNNTNTAEAHRTAMCNPDKRLVPEDNETICQADVTAPTICYNRDKKLLCISVTRRRSNHS